MGRKFNALQRSFVVRNVTGKSPNDLARKDFEHRKQTILGELAKLDPNHPDRRRLEQLFAAAEQKTTGANPDFDAAYDDLETVKVGARNAARSYVRNVSPVDTTVELSRIQNRVQLIGALVQQSHDEMADLLQALKDEPLPQNPNFKDIVAFRQAVTQKEAAWRAELAACKKMTDEAGQAATGLNLPVTLSMARTDIGVMTQSKDRKVQTEGGKLARQLDAVDTGARLGGALYDSGIIQKAFADQAKAFEVELKRLKIFQNRDAGPGTGDRFKALEEREDRVMQAAVQAYSNAGATDAVVLSPANKQPTRPKPAALPKFRPGDVLPDTLDMAANYDAQAIQQAAQQVGQATAALLQGEAQRSSNSDILFDATTKSLAGLKTDIAKALKLQGRSKDWPQDKLALVDAMAQAMRDAAVAANPNKASAATVPLQHDNATFNVPQTIALNGVNYGNPKILGKGGLGLVTSYEGPNVNGASETIVIKSATQQGEKGRGELGLEMEAHRRMMGGEAHTPPANVVEMKGAAVSPDGTLHMIMKQEAGDTENFANAVSVMARSGALPKAAQKAMQQETMLRAAEGLKAMQDNGLLHNDIKPANFLIGPDGSVKIADLGSAEDETAKRKNQPDTTPAFVAPDYFGGKRSDKSDVHALGVMLGAMSLEGGIEEMTPFGAFGGDLGGAFKTDKNQTSLDRLRNAMVDPDPNKRPTLDGVLMSSYLNDARDNYGDEDGGGAAGTSQQQGGKSDMTALRKAISAYVSVAGKRVTKLNQEISALNGKLRKAAQDAASDPAKEQTYQTLLAAHPGAVADLQAQIDAIHQEPDIAKLLDAVRKASEPFGTSTDNKADRAWDFAYNKTMKLIDQLNRKQPDMPADLLSDIRSQPGLRTAAESMAANPPRAAPLQPRANRQ